MTTTRAAIRLFAALAVSCAFAQAQSKRPLQPDDIFELKTVADPRISPDGRYLAFLSSRDGKKTQVYLLDRRGGDAQALTSYKTGASAIAWSPDSRKLALLVPDPDPDDPNPDADAKDKKPRPHVITRLQ